MGITFKFLSFQEWIKANPDIADSIEECDECDGVGEIECYHCGQDMTCEKCGGTGSIVNDKGGSLKMLYEEQLKSDNALVDRWTKATGLEEVKKEL